MLSSRESLVMLSHAFIRSTARCLNSVLCRSRFLRSTFQLLSCKVSNTEMYHSRGSLQMNEKRRNGFWNSRKCFRMKVTPTVGV
jgi:hypothetical protein